MLFALTCGDLYPILKLVKTIISIIQIGIPIILIVLGMLDLGKAVAASKEDEIKKAQSMLIKRFIYAALIFFVVFFVKLVMSVVADNGGDRKDANNWVDCWNATSSKDTTKIG